MTGGLNFDAKVRRQSIDTEDLFYAHIGGMDAFARGLEIAQAIVDDGALDKLVDARYEGWTHGFGKKVLDGHKSFADHGDHVIRHGEPKRASGRQERFENLINEYIL